MTKSVSPQDLVKFLFSYLALPGTELRDLGLAIPFESPLQYSGLSRLHTYLFTIQSGWPVHVHQIPVWLAIALAQFHTLFSWIRLGLDLWHVFSPRKVASHWILLSFYDEIRALFACSGKENGQDF